MRLHHVAYVLVLQVHDRMLMGCIDTNVVFFVNYSVDAVVVNSNGEVQEYCCYDQWTELPFQLCCTRGYQAHC